ncbi:hypothetical protein [Desulfopila inferna]|uniref:hypothetical protein n=1 Tax=Desulfopila inferna TaxID=468528 RepID=UPI0019655CF1|nr:hypothetical protein [Desulfopila inferna]MBM9606392.1 hypothetical protein [Desulfopila inferna]
MLKKNIRVSLCCFLSAALLALGLSGCSVIQTLEGLGVPDPEIGSLFHAEYAFFAGNYTLAEELYSKVRNNSEKPFYVNQAVYGLASLAIITAENTNELELALAMMEQWQEPGVEVDGYGENPKMLATAISAQVDLLECRPEIRYVTTKKEGELIKKHQEEIEELQKTIKKLEHQISVLEAIDQEIQEKRKP